MASSPLPTPTHSLLLEHSESTSPTAIMAKQGSSSHNLAGMVEADKTPGRILVGSSDPSAASNMPPTPRHPSTRKRARGPFTTGVPRNPQIGEGLQAAVAEPAATRLRVAEPIRGAATEHISAARLHAFRAVHVLGILSFNSDLCCDGRCDSPYCAGTGTRSRPLDTVEDATAAGCRRCCRPLAGAIHMYMGMRFCTRRCRYDFSMAAAAPASSRRRVVVGVQLVTQVEHEGL